MKIGTLDVEKVYLGNTEISKIYLGSTSVYENSAPQPEGKLYAYTNGDDTIYTIDEVLQGTFKSLNTNDFTDDGVSIDSDGIATFSDNTSSTNLKLTAKTALFGTGINNYYKIHIRMSQTSFSQWTSFFNFSPYTENYKAACHRHHVSPQPFPHEKGRENECIQNGSPFESASTAQTPDTA